MVTVDLNIPVICYGLRSDFSLKGFPGSTRLLELAHTIEEMKTICTCGRKATCNCRKVNGEFVFEGEQVAIDLENDVQYVSMCPQCYFKAPQGFYAKVPKQQHSLRSSRRRPSRTPVGAFFQLRFIRGVISISVARQFARFLRY